MVVETLNHDSVWSQLGISLVELAFDIRWISMLTHT